MKNNNNIKELINERLSNDYIAGFIHGNGGFSVQLIWNKSKNRIGLQPMFTLTQHNRNIDLIIKIIERFNNVGYYQIDNKNIMRYRISSIEDLKKVIIPFFDKNQVKNDKLLNFIKLKFIIEKLDIIDKNFRWYSYSIDNKYNKLMLDLITISVNMNKNVKPSIQVEKLSDKDKEKVLKNNLSLEIKKELYDYIKNYNYKKDLNIDFINGLFDSEGWIVLRLNLHKKKNSIFLGWEYGIVSDLLNLELLYDIQKYFNNVGSIYKRNDKNSVSFLVCKTECLLEVFPKVYNVSNYLDILEKNNNIKGPIIKDNKIKVILKILKLYEEYKKINKIDKDKRNLILEKILVLSYDIREIKLKNKELLNDYLIRMKKKLYIYKNYDEGIV